MATIRKRNGKWQAQIRLKGISPRTATFATKSKASKWAGAETQRLLQGETTSLSDVRQLRGMTLRDLAKAWEQAGGITTANVTGFRHLLNDPISGMLLTEITPKETNLWRNRLLSTLKPDSVRRYSRVPRGAWQFGLDTLELPIRAKNPFCSLGLKKVKSKRQRRLYPNEYERLIAVCGLSLQKIITWSIETGMRRGETAKARVTHLSEDYRFLFLAETKTDTPRRIPLTKKAQEIARGQVLLGLAGGRLFPYTGRKITGLFTKACRKAAIEDLRFHDLRHEALSRLNANGLSVFDIKLISGHRRVDSLDVYIHSELERVAAKIGA